ncbi:DOMON-like domain-containing protein [Uliginosibacterium sp. H3]|uniref:DOMON-like domain-containing protein n=1 Tax=Uliginosibacterium silvisoli TaxID=3114758 RepID=A0ABU6K1M6_9RHOO|nr:DOMON-like domain-containing protein [Uliginosibacterium sp. H3]
MVVLSRLICHPAHPCAAVTALQASASLAADGSLQLLYTLTGALDALRIPAPTQSGFADELWKHTCFEAFVSHAEATSYHEFNFSPTGQWAAYAFSDYRQRDAGWQPAQAPDFNSRQTPDALTLAASIPATLLPARSGILHIGLTAVVETIEGAISYWALAHPGERPDFHLRAAFTLQLANSS